MFLDRLLGSCCFIVDEKWWRQLAMWSRGVFNIHSLVLLKEKANAQLFLLSVHLFFFFLTCVAAGIVLASVARKRCDFKGSRQENAKEKRTNQSCREREREWWFSYPEYLWLPHEHSLVAPCRGHQRLLSRFGLTVSR